MLQKQMHEEFKWSISSHAEMIYLEIISSYFNPIIFEWLEWNLFA